MHMIPIVECQEKIAKDLWKTTKNIFARNGIICQDNCNSLNFDFKKLVNYHKANHSHTCF
jgi:hypothetical protein